MKWCKSLKWHRRGALLFFKSSAKFQGQSGRKFDSLDPNWTFLAYKSWFEFTPDGYEMMHKAWSAIEQGPYRFTRSSIKFPRHTGQKIDDLSQNWEFLDCNYSLNSQMATKLCINLEVA